MDRRGVRKRPRWPLPTIFVCSLVAAVVVSVGLVVGLTHRNRPEVTSPPPTTPPYNVTFSMYLIDMQMVSNVNADDQKNCYILSDMIDITKDTLNGLDDAVQVAFLTYLQDDNSASITKFMSRKDAISHLGSIKPPTMKMEANEKAAMTLYDQSNLVSQLVHFVPCDWMKMGDTTDLFSMSLQKLVLISGDKTQEQIKTNYGLTADSNYSTVILDQSVSKSNLSQYLDDNLPPVATTLGTPRTSRATSVATTTMTTLNTTPESTTTPIPFCKALFVMDESQKASEPVFAMEGYVVMVSAKTVYQAPDYQFSTNAWRYMDNGDPPPPTDFLSNYKDFEALVRSFPYQNFGKATILDAVSDLNSWPVDDAVIVLFTNSDQEEIDAAALNYRWKNHTVAVALGSQDVHQLGIETVPNSWDWVTYGLLNVCALLNNRTIPTTTPATTTTTTTQSTTHKSTTTKKTTTKKTTTTTTTTTPTTTSHSTVSTPSTSPWTTTPAPATQCQVYFILDGSDLGKANGDEQKAATLAAGKNIYSSMELYPQVWMYSDGSTDKDLPYAILTDQTVFEKTVNQQIFTGGGDTVIDAVNKMNDPKLYSWPLMVLFTGSDEEAIQNASSIYIRKEFTIGVSLTGESMNELADHSATFDNLPDILLSVCQYPPTHYPKSTS